MHHFKPYTLHLRGRDFVIDHPLIMGILNVTPDSFYTGSRCSSEDDIEKRVKQMIDEGVDIIDVGACSTRPGALEVDVDEELARLKRALDIIYRVAPDMVISVDTFRSSIACQCILEYGADMVNDVSGGTLDEQMFTTVAQLQVPYVLMHMRGTPETMQSLTEYKNGVVNDVFGDLQNKIKQLRNLGVVDIICDLGFGFAKTVEQNYELLIHLDKFQALGAPLMVGVSRKSMIYRALDTTPEESLNGTTVLNTIALMKGAHIIRVHDVKAAVEARKLVQLTLNNE